MGDFEPPKGTYFDPRWSLLNRPVTRECVLPTVYGPEHPIQRWRGHRLIGVDGALVRLPDSEELGQTFGWTEASNQHGRTGTRYPEAR